MQLRTPCHSHRRRDPDTAIDLSHLLAGITDRSARGNTSERAAGLAAGMSSDARHEIFEVCDGSIEKCRPTYIHGPFVYIQQYIRVHTSFNSLALEDEAEQQETYYIDIHREKITIFDEERQSTEIPPNSFGNKRSTPHTLPRACRWSRQYSLNDRVVTRSVRFLNQ